MAVAISRIGPLTNARSCTGLSSPDTLPFIDANLIFGHNGSGKSTLASQLAQEYLRQGGNEDAVELFNREYAERNIRFAKNGVRGVTTWIGRRNVEIGTQIHELSEKIEEGEKEIGEALADLQSKNEVAHALIQTLFDSARKGARVHRKSAGLTPAEVVAAWRLDYEAARQRFSDDQILAADNNAIVEERLEEVKKITIPSPVPVEGSLLRRASGLAGVPVPSPEGGARIIGWLKEGLALHDEEYGCCRFCQSGVDARELLTKVSQRIEDFEGGQLDELVQIGDKMADELAARRADATMLRAALNADQALNARVESALAAAAVLEGALEVAHAAIKHKINDPAECVEFPEEALSDSKAAYVKALAGLAAGRDQLLTELQEASAHAARLLRGAVYLALAGSSLLSKVLGEIAGTEARIQQIRVDLDGLKEERRRLHAESSDIGGASAAMNKELQVAGAGFALQPDGDSYVLVSEDPGVTLTVEALSEGEVNLLALIYFYHTIIVDSRMSPRDGLELIIVDDPTTSLDYNNRFYINELMRMLLEQRSVQTFVFSHAWNDFRDIGYGHAGSGEGGFHKYLLTKQGGCSSLASMPHPIENPYHLMIRDLVRFASETDEEEWAPWALHMPNCMRRIIEEYVAFNGLLPGSSSKDAQKIAQTFVKRGNAPVRKVRRVLLVANTYSHRTAEVPAPAQVHSAAKDLVQLLEESSQRMTQVIAEMRSKL